MQPYSDQPDKLQKRKFKKMKQMISDKLQNFRDEEVSDSEQVDLSIELHPIKHYVDDKEEMIEQMFTSLGPTLIQNMLPPLLKTVPLNELKADCLIQLLGMSKKRIFTSIDGKELQSSSESDFDSDASSSSEKKSVKSKKVPVQTKAAKRKYIIDADTLNVSIDNEDDLDNLSLSDGETSKTSRKRKSTEKVKKSKHKQPKHAENGFVEVEGASPISISSNEGSDAERDVKPVVPKKGQTLLEILELEMRAKAIRSLLKQGTSGSPQPGNESEAGNSLFDPNIKIKPEPREPEPDPDIIEIIEPPPPQPIVVDSEDESEKPNSDTETPKSTSVTDTAKAEPAKSEAATGNKDTTPNSTSTSNVTDNAEKSDPKTQGPSWSERYLENKETEKLIKTSKMCTNIRKRMRLVRSMHQRQHVKEKVDIPVVIGSISEYKQLVGNENSSNSLKSGENEIPETNESETPKDITTEVPVTNESSTSVTSNTDKTDLVCSDILEIDISIADLDPDCSTNSSGSGTKNKKSEELIKAVLNPVNDLRSKGINVDIAVTKEGVIQIDEDQRAENEACNKEKKDEATPGAEKRGIEANSNDHDECQIKDGGNENESQNNEAGDGENSCKEGISEKNAAERENQTDTHTEEKEIRQNDRDEEEENSDQEVVHIDLIEDDDENVEEEKGDQNHAEASTLVGDSSKKDGESSAVDDETEERESSAVDDEKEEGEIDEEPERPVTKEKPAVEREEAQKNLMSDEIIVID
nr:PREDICTED: microtubule-associated protein futsch-like [Bemisia tabaci]